jgi:PKHD-type hydroxylase
VSVPLRLPSRVITPLLFHDVFSANECDLIVNEGCISTGESWWIGREDPVRRSAFSTTLSRVDSVEWVFKRLTQVMHAANSDFQFSVTEIDEKLLFAKYQTNDHFDWHIDLGEEDIAARKLSIAVLLSPRKTFTGGEWQFQFDDASATGARQGSAVVFPSFLPHRVSKITSGTRHSLVGWMFGPAFN